MSILKVIGIYEDEIEHAFEECKSALQTVLLSSKTDKIEEEISKANLFEALSNFTNMFIETMFEITQGIIENEYPELDTSYYVNGWDSHFYLNDNDLFQTLYNKDIEPELIKRCMKTSVWKDLEADVLLQLADDKYVFEDFIKAKENGNEEEYYGSIEELGEDSDGGCREEDDTDETYGLFLIQAYKDGCSRDLYFELKNGTIIAIELAN